MTEKSPADNDLAPGRECGRCTVCCKTLKIDVPELKKLADVLCAHCADGAGCKIYDRRPPVCGGYYCGWRGMAHLSEHWRPDRCGILISFVGKGEGIPAEFPQIGLKFDMVELAARPDLGPVDQVHRLGDRAGPPRVPGRACAVGYERRKVFLNYAMANAVASHQRDLVIEGLASAFRLGLQDGMMEKTIFG